MLRLGSDADVHGEIIRGLRRRRPEIDLVRARDALPEGTPDLAVLAWRDTSLRAGSTHSPTALGCSSSSALILEWARTAPSRLSRWMRRICFYPWSSST